MSPQIDSPGSPTQLPSGRTETSAAGNLGPNTTRFFVEGRPAPQGSKSFKGMRAGKPVLVESSTAVKPWRESIAWIARTKTRPRQGAVGVRLDFVMPRPKRYPLPTPPCTVRNGDTDKLARACLDALTGIAYDDDSQVVSLMATKRTAEPDERPGVAIEITTVTPHTKEKL